MSLNVTKNLLLFDVESASLFGKAIAVGAIVADWKGNILEEFSLRASAPEKKSDEWVKKNVIPVLGNIPICKTGSELRTHFYDWYLKYKKSCTIWSDVNFPVETNFLAAIVADDPQRAFNMPFPLYDVSAYLPLHIDRITHCGISGFQKHNPLHDAKASYYSLLNAIENNHLYEHFNILLSDGK